jgi:adenylate cyclase
MVVNKDNVGELWRDWFMTDANSVERKVQRIFHALPHDPRCKLCNAPFQGFGGVMVGTLFGRRQSSLNPQFCNICEAFAQKFPGGAEVEMSMLFVDVRGSTALSESMSAMEFQKLINRFFVETTKIIGDEFGLVEKLAGDAVAAFWGAGFAGKDYVARTIRSAQRIQKAMNTQNIPVGVGVHTGIAYFGAMGEESGLINISAIGDEVNTAARIASKAAAGEILLSEAALHSQTEIDPDQLETRTLELKGISKPLTVRVMRG